MRLVTVIADKAGRARRYKCTCGHTEDLKEDKWGAVDDLALNLDGFQEIP